MTLFFTLVLAVVVIAAVVCGIAWKVAYEDGWEARGLHDQNTRSERRLARQRQEEADFDAWIAQLKEPGAAEFERLAATNELVTLYEYDPRTGTVGGLMTHTAQICASTDTGAFRALTQSTDAYLARMAAEEEAYRRGISS